MTDHDDTITITPEAWAGGCGRGSIVAIDRRLYLVQSDGSPAEDTPDGYCHGSPGWAEPIDPADVDPDDAIHLLAAWLHGTGGSVADAVPAHSDDDATATYQWAGGGVWTRPRDTWVVTTDGQAWRRVWRRDEPTTDRPIAADEAADVIRVLDVDYDHRADDIDPVALAVSLAERDALDELWDYHPTRDR